MKTREKEKQKRSGDSRRHEKEEER